MSEAIEVEGFQLQCDAPGCDYVSPRLNSVDRSMVGTPCPKCGARLLTEDDFEAFGDAMALLDAAKDLAAAIGLNETDDPKGEARLSVNAHNGTITFEMLKWPDAANKDGDT